MALVQIIAVVKPFRARAILDALRNTRVLSGTVREVMGFGRQKHRLHRYLGSEYSASFVPKVELALVVDRSDEAGVVRAIVGQARTGRMGDGKILVIPCSDEHILW